MREREDILRDRVRGDQRNREIEADTPTGRVEN